MDEYLDFDRFMAEMEGETLKVKVYGTVYTVKREIPAILPLTLARAEGKGRADLGRAVLNAAEMLFGSEAIDHFCSRGMSSRALSALVQHTLQRIIREDRTETLDDDGGVPVYDGGKT